MVECLVVMEEVRALLFGDFEVVGMFEVGLRFVYFINVGREWIKMNNIKVVYEMWLALRELGCRAVERGVFDNVE